MSWLGLDIGGANVKLADGVGLARCVPFPLWRNPQDLAPKLAELFAAAPSARQIAVTMTGELCDCFRTKADGVRHILAAVESAATGREVHVYLNDGRFVPLQQSGELVHLAAASNWHALAQFCCRFLEGRAGLLVDVGSTTTDVVPLAEGQPAAIGTNDTQRLTSGELIYTGIARTPICAVTRRLPWRGMSCRVAAEVFATTADAYAVLGDVSEQPDATWTADGRPLTVQFARERLARMICADAMEFTLDDARAAAAAVREKQLGQLSEATAQVLARLPANPDCVIVSGAGEFLARMLVAKAYPACQMISLADRLGTNVSTSAPAHAVAILAAERAGT